MPPKAAAEEKKPKGGVKLRTEKRRTWIKRKKGTSFKDYRKQKLHRRPKAWDFKNKDRKKRDLPVGLTKEFVLAWNKLKCEKLVRKNERLARGHCRRFRYAHSRKDQRPRIRRRKDFKFMPKQYTAAWRKVKLAWRWRVYRNTFGPYPTKENLVKYFADNAKNADKKMIPDFVNFNYNKHMNLSNLIHHGRKRLSAHVGARSRKAPKCLKKTKMPLKELKADPQFIKWMKTVINKAIKNINDITLAYIVEHVRCGGLLTHASKDNILKFAAAK